MVPVKASEVSRVFEENSGACCRAKFSDALKSDVHAHEGSSIVIAGDHLPPAVHAFAHAMNARLGNVGKTIFYSDPVDANPINQIESLKELVADMNAGKVDLLVILGGNPAYDAPADLNFAEVLKGNKFRCASPRLYKTRPLNSASGTSTPRTNSKPGAMRAPTTALPALFSR